MYKKKLAILTFSLILSFSLFSEANDLQLGTYGTNKYPFMDMAKYSVTNIGYGIGLEYTMPFCHFVGVSARAEAESVITKRAKHSNWWDFTFTGGVYGNFYWGDIFNFRPEVSYGAVLHLLDVMGETSLFTDQIVQGALSCRFTSEALFDRNLTIEAAPVYTLAIEKNTLSHYLGFRFGFYYRFF